MSKVSSAVLVALLMVLANAAYAEAWNLAKNVRRLEAIAPDYKDDKPIDKKFLDVLDLTEKTKSENAVYEEAKRIAAMPTLAQSKYMDSFLYYMLVRSAAQSKQPAAEMAYWMAQLKTSEKSQHLLAAWLVYLKQLPRKSPENMRETQQMVDWIKAQKPDMKVRAPEYSGNILMGYKPRADFADGDYPKLYSLANYKMAVKPYDGFRDEDTYVLQLARLKDGREDITAEVAEIYRKAGKREEASDALFQLAAFKVNAKDFQRAKAILDDAVKQNPKNEAAVKERDRIKLELTYESLAPAPVAVPETAAASAPASTTH